MAPGVAPEELLQPDDRLEVEVVGGLVEEQRVGRHEQDAGQRHAHLPAAGQGAHVAVHGLGGESQAGQDLPGPGLEAVAAQLVEAGLDVAEPLDQLLHLVGAVRIGQRVLQLVKLGGHRRDRTGAVHGLGHGAAPRHLADVLREVAHGDAAVDGDLPLVRLLLAGDEPEERRLPGAVGADQPDLLAAVDDRRGLDEEDLVAVLHGDGVETDQGAGVLHAAGRRHKRSGLSSTLSPVAASRRSHLAEHVTLPLWALVALLVLAAVALLDRALVPGARWFLRRRVNRAIDEINRRLRLRIRPFKLTRRAVLIDRLTFDPRVVEAAEAHARDDRRAPRGDHGPGGLLRAGDRPVLQHLRLLPPGLLGGPGHGADPLPGPRRVRRRRRPIQGGPGGQRGLRDEPPVQHGLRARLLPGRREDRALLRGGGVGPHLAAPVASSVDGGLLRPARLGRSALPEGAGALRADGRRRRRGPGHVPGGRAHQGRGAAPSPARAARLHAARLRPGPARPGLRAGGAQLRPGPRGPHPARRRGRASAAARPTPRSARSASPCATPGSGWAAAGTASGMPA